MHNNLGNSYREFGDLNSAKEHLEKARAMMSPLYGDEKTEEMAKVTQRSRVVACRNIRVHNAFSLSSFWIKS